MRSLQAARRLVNRESGAPFGRITFSAGMAVLSAGEEGEAALSRADAALYRAKDQGRNRLVVA